MLIVKQMSVTRYDIGELAPAKKTPEGFLRVDARLTRTGIFEYRNPDGSTRRELRKAEQVFDAATLESFSGTPVTDDHPGEMVTPATWASVAKGNIAGELKRDGEFVRASLLVTDPALVAKMDGGKTQISCGYLCDLEPTPGTWRGEKYDAVQTNIRGNHVAIVDVGRAGAACAARMDSGTFVEEKKTVKSIVVNSIKFDVEDTVAQAFEADRAKSDAALDAAKTAADKSAARADASEKALADLRASVPGLVSARVALEKTAGAIAEGVKFDGKSDRDIKVIVIEKTGGTVKADASDAYVDARYDAAVEQAARAGNSALAELRVTADNAERSDASAKPDASAKYRADVKGLWKSDIPGAVKRA